MARGASALSSSSDGTGRRRNSKNALLIALLPLVLILSSIPSSVVAISAAGTDAAPIEDSAVHDGGINNDGGAAAAADYIQNENHNGNDNGEYEDEDEDEDEDEWIAEYYDGGHEWDRHGEEELELVEREDEEEQEYDHDQQLEQRSSLRGLGYAKRYIRPHPQGYYGGGHYQHGKGKGKGKGKGSKGSKGQRYYYPRPPHPTHPTPPHDPYPTPPHDPYPNPNPNPYPNPGPQPHPGPPPHDPTTCQVPDVLRGPSLVSFNKFNFSGTIDGAVHIRKFPDLSDPYVQQNIQHCMNNVVGSTGLTWQDFPIHLPSSRWVKQCLKWSNAISVRDEQDYAVEHCIGDLLLAIGAHPHFPVPNNHDAPFWGELRRVVDLQIERRTNSSALAKDVLTHMTLPDNWMQFTLDGINSMAQAVYDEPPCYWQSDLLRRMLKDVGKFGDMVVDEKIIKWRGTSVEFLEGVILVHDTCLWSVMHVSNYNFAAKYYVGMARPEEVVCAILKKDIAEEHVPNDLLMNIKSNFKSLPDTCEGFTAYPDGAPRHPSYPAMHSAASNLSFWLMIVMNPTDAMICAAKKIDYAVSYARSLAGVHYPQDNIVGLNLGQEVLARNFCRHITEKFHGDYEHCMWKVQKKRFDWRYEDPKNFAECASAAASKPPISGIEVVDGNLVAITTESAVFGPSFDDLEYCAAV